VQGPINKEPDEKLDPANKPTGIRKLYVLDSNNYLIVVIDIKLDELFFSIINFIINNKINTPTPTMANESSNAIALITSSKKQNLFEYESKKCLKELEVNANALSNPSFKSSQIRSCQIRRYISSRSCDSLIEKYTNRPNNNNNTTTITNTTTTTTKSTNSSFSLIVVVLLNIFYLLFCLKTNTILISCFMFMFNVLMCKKVIYFVLLLTFSHFVMTRFRVKVKLKNKKRTKAKGVIFSKKKKFMTF
jgi:hypothetical protein